MMNMGKGLFLESGAVCTDRLPHLEAEKTAVLQVEFDAPIL
jgi:hypothetical protein